MTPDLSARLLASRDAIRSPNLARQQLHLYRSVTWRIHEHSRNVRPIAAGYRVISGVAVVDVVGEVDMFTCGLLRDRPLLAVTDAYRRSLVINLAEVSFMDSTGLGVLIG